MRQGNRQLVEFGRSAPEGRLGLRSLATLVTGRKVGVVDAGCYLGVMVLDRSLTRLRGSGNVRWGSDPTSRADSMAAS